MQSNMQTENKRHIFILGFDEFNYNNHLKPLETQKNCVFFPLLSIEELQTNRKESVLSLLKRCEKILDEFEWEIDGIITYWDFPATLLQPLLNKKYNLRGAAFENVLKAEHKYWSREIQRNSALEECPPFDVFNPVGGEQLSKISLEPPYWIKPIKSYLSQLSFKIEDQEDFNQAMPLIKQKAWAVSEGFDDLMELGNVPERIKNIKGSHFIAEKDIRGEWQGTLEGHVFEGQFASHGIVDTITYPDSPALFCLRYPSIQSEDVKSRIIQASKKVITAMGIDNAAFNIEFFYNPDTDKLWLLEINTRISQSHSPNFVHVDGVGNQSILVDLALGKKPEPALGGGEFKVSGKFMMRVFEDAFVANSIAPEDKERICAKYHGTLIKNEAPHGKWLSETPNQDNHSFLLAEVFVGAKNNLELFDKFEQIKKEFNFVLDSKGRETYNERPQDHYQPSL